MKPSSPLNAEYISEYVQCMCILKRIVWNALAAVLVVHLSF